MQKIDLSELYKDDKSFLSDLNKMPSIIKKYKSYEGNVFSSAIKLYEFLEFDTNTSKNIEKLYLYAHINNDLDMDNTKYQEYYEKVVKLLSDLNEKTSFVVPEILDHDYAEFTKYVKEFPKLNEYKLNMKSIFRMKKLMKSKNEEEIISILTSTYSRSEVTSERLINIDLDYGTIKDENNKEVELTNSNYSVYLESSERNVRKDTFDAIYKEFKKHQNTFGSLLGTEVMNNNKIAKIRGYKSARSLSLYKNEVKDSIYDSLIKGITNNLPTFYKYYDLKKKVLGLKDFHIYDAYAPITKEVNKKYSYDEAKKIILDSLSILGEDYNKVLKSSFDNNWIDSRIIKTKRSGAYCTCAYLTHPYVVMSYEGKVNDISTLAHELGHAMHYYYAKENNTYQDYNYSIFVAEVASQVNEIILTDYMLKNTNNKEEKKYLLDLILNRFKATMIRQTMFADFEDAIHNYEMNGGALTNDYLTSTYYDLNKKYFGKNVVVDEDIKYEAYRIPHFYYNFYVYQYATGYAAALKIASSIINKEDGALEKYLKFLKLGSTKDPVSSLKIAGIDMNDEKLYDDVFKIFEDKLNELRNLYE